MQTENERSTSTPGASTPTAANRQAPETVHTVVSPSADTAPARPGLLTAWIVVPLLIGVLLLLGFFMVPGWIANSEGKDPPRRVNDSEQSRPE